MRSTLVFVLFAWLFVSAQCANVLNVECEHGPFDTAEEEQHVHCHVTAEADFPISQIFGFAYVPLNEPTNPNPNYVPEVENCEQTFSTPTTSASLECEVHLPRFAPDGEYTFTVYVIGSQFLSNTSFFEVEEEANDRVPPTLVGITAPLEYNAFFPTSNWVVLDIEDDASGIHQIYYSIHTTPTAGDELFFGHWEYLPSEDDHGHDHDHEHEEEEEEEEESEEDHEHEHEAEPSAPTDLHITLPLNLNGHADEFTPGVYYLSVHIWDGFWDVRYTSVELRNNGFTWNVTLLPPSNCNAGKYGPRIDKPNRCVNCPIGTYSEAGATKCGACPSGSIPNHANTECEQCPLGTYEFEGVLCVRCPRGKSAPLGAHSRHQCEKV